MGRRLRTEEIRRKRAEARAAIRGHRIGTEVACRVPCAHGHETGCLVYFVARLDGSMLHVSSDCSRKAPPADEVVVMRGLLGESKYRSCTDVVDGVKRVMTSLDDWQARRHAMQTLPISDESHPVLWHAIEAAREVALEHHQAGDSPFEDHATEVAEMKTSLRSRALARVVRDVPLPPSWCIRVRAPRGARTLSVYMKAWSWGESHEVAVYRSGGRFVLRPSGIAGLALSYDSDRPRDRYGKKPCSVCGKSITSPSAHVKTNRHEANVDEAVLDALEVIGPRLARRDWRDHQTPAKSGKE